MKSSSLEDGLYGRDLLRMYLKEAVRYPLLGREQEYRLSKIMAEGSVSVNIHYANGMRISKMGNKMIFSGYSRDDERGIECLAEKLEDKNLLEGYEISGNGRKTAVFRIDRDSGIVLDRGVRRTFISIKTPYAMNARQKLVNNNLRLVVSIAKKFKGSRIPLIDLIQEGNKGLLNAVDRFDYSRGIRVSTYVYGGIIQSIVGSLSKNKSIIGDYEYVNKNTGQTGNSGSINSLFSSEVDVHSLLAILPDKKFQPPEEMVIKEEERQRAWDVLEKVVGKKAREVVYMRFFLNMPYREIGNTLGLCPEGVRQAELRAIERLQKRLIEKA